MSRPHRAWAGPYRGSCEQDCEAVHGQVLGVHDGPSADWRPGRLGEPDLGPRGHTRDDEQRRIIWVSHSRSHAWHFRLILALMPSARAHTDHTNKTPGSIQSHIWHVPFIWPTLAHCWQYVLLAKSVQVAECAKAMVPPLWHFAFSTHGGIAMGESPANWQQTIMASSSTICG